MSTDKLAAAQPKGEEVDWAKLESLGWQRVICKCCGDMAMAAPKADERGVNEVKSAEPVQLIGPFGHGVATGTLSPFARDGSEPGLITGDEGKYTAVEYKLGAWLSAALNDDETCAEFRADIEAWMRQIEQRAEPQGLTDEQIVLLWQSEVGRDHPDTIDKVRFSRALLVLAARASAGRAA